MVQQKLSNAPITAGETTAHELAKKQREIGVAEFFARNKHLLGFDNKRKSLLTTIKEAVDNALDACEEAKTLPEIIVEVIDMGDERFRVIVEDNGPGIVKKQIPKIFAKLLYGSKFHSMKQSRGQQGIGISAAVMYGQMTTGRPARITSKIHKDKPAIYMEVGIDTQSNRPVIYKESEKEWNKESGTRIEIDLKAAYQKGTQSIDEYLKQTAITNPHAMIIYTNPKAEQIIFPRVIEKLPKEPIEIKPHPYGVELGIMQNMLSNTLSKTLQAFLTSEFTRVGSGTAKNICENAALLPKTRPSRMSREMIEDLMKGIEKTKLMSPPTNCISPISSDQIEDGLKKEIDAEFYVAVTRPPTVYKGNPFQIEVGIAYGGEQAKDGSINILRCANRVPLQYKQGDCAITKAITSISWRPYGLSQSSGQIPVGPCSLMIHIASVWVPFTSESKEAIAHYPEIIKEIRLALQECGRKLSSYVRKKKRLKDQMERANIFERYIPEIADSIAQLSGEEKSKILAGLMEMVAKPEIQEETEVNTDDGIYKLGNTGEEVEKDE